MTYDLSPQYALAPEYDLGGDGPPAPPTGFTVTVLDAPDP